MQPDFSHFPFRDSNNNPSFTVGQEETISGILNSLIDFDYVRVAAQVGSGKSVINYTVAKNTGKTVYLTAQKQLQDQIDREGWKGVSALKGRNAYICTKATEFPNIYWCDGSTTFSDPETAREPICFDQPKFRYAMNRDAMMKVIDNIGRKVKQEDLRRDIKGFQGKDDFEKFRKIVLEFIDRNDMESAIRSCCQVACNFMPIECPYKAAKYVAVNIADVAVLNPDIYWFLKKSFINPFADIKLLVVDEAHMMDDILLRLFKMEMNIDYIKRVYGINIHKIGKSEEADFDTYTKRFNGFLMSPEGFFFPFSIMLSIFRPFLGFPSLIIKTQEILELIKDQDFRYSCGIAASLLDDLKENISFLYDHGLEEINFGNLLMSALEDEGCELDKMDPSLWADPEDLDKTVSKIKYTLKFIFADLCAGYGIEYVPSGDMVSIKKPYTQVQKFLRKVKVYEKERNIAASALKNICGLGTFSKDFLIKIYNMNKTLRRMDDCFVYETKKEEKWDKFLKKKMDDMILRFVPVKTGYLLRSEFYDRSPNSELKKVPIKVVATSGTWPSPDMMAVDLGLTDSSGNGCGYVESPAEFHPDIRPVYMNTNYNYPSFSDKVDTDRGKRYWYETEEGLRSWNILLAKTILHIQDKSKRNQCNTNIAIHAVSFKIIQLMIENFDFDSVDSKFLFHIPKNTAFNKRDGTSVLFEEKAKLLEEFMDNSDSNRILVSPSIEEGCDFKYDICRAQIIIKKPIPFWGDIYNRHKANQNKVYMETKSLIRINQAHGRNVRMVDDYGETYILDTAFSRPMAIRLNDDRARLFYGKRRGAFYRDSDIYKRLNVDYIVSGIVHKDGKPWWPID